MLIVFYAWCMYVCVRACVCVCVCVFAVLCVWLAVYSRHEVMILMIKGL